MGDATWHTSGLGDVSRWTLHAHRDPERAAVDLWHALTRGGGAGKGGQCTNACILSPLVVGVLLLVTRLSVEGATDSVFQRRWVPVLGHGWIQCGVFPRQMANDGACSINDVHQDLIVDSACRLLLASASLEMRVVGRATVREESLA